jgi:hypothetical protein
MAEIETSRVAEMLFVEMPLCDFSRTISELDQLLTRISGHSPRLTWDCDDVASFDMPGTRILLSLSDSPYPGYAGRLVVSVGPSPMAPRAEHQLMVHTALCSRLVSRLKERCEPSALIWSDIKGVVGADEVDMLAEGISQPTSGPRRPGIFTPGQRTEGNEARQVKALREALHPYGPGVDFPAASSRLAQQAVDMAMAVAFLPFTAVHYAAAIYRATVH